MLSGLFKQAQDKAVAADKERAQGSGAREPESHSLQDSREEPETRSGPALRPSLERGLTTALSTPHDAVLAELFSHRTGPAVGRTETTTEKGEVVPEENNRARSISRVPLHDPFAGSLIGLTIEDDGNQTGINRTHEFETRKEDLWSYMTNIREIQTQIANMHVTMENIGLGAADELRVERGHSTGVSEGEKWEDGDDEGEEKEREAREAAEFKKLGDKFHGRKEATENIMTKVRMKYLLQLYLCAHQVTGSSMSCPGS